MLQRRLHGFSLRRPKFRGYLIQVYSLLNFGFAPSTTSVFESRIGDIRTLDSGHTLRMNSLKPPSLSPAPSTTVKL